MFEGLRKSIYRYRMKMFGGMRKSLCRHRKQFVIAHGKNGSIRMFYCMKCRQYRAVDKFCPTGNTWFDNPYLASLSIRTFAPWPQNWLVNLDTRRRGF